jgi:DNA ligase 1
MFSKGGKELRPPESFTRELPPVALDGELWGGRGAFEHVVGVLNSKDGDWSGITYHLLDLPHSVLQYEARLAELSELRLPANVRVTRPILCRGARHLEETVDEIEKGGGEGVLARKARSSYEPGRSSSLLRITVWSRRVHLLYTCPEVPRGGCQGRRPLCWRVALRAVPS